MLNIFGFLIPGWLKYVAILVLLASIFGAGYLKGKQHEQDKQNAALVEFYEKQLVEAKKQADIENAAAKKAQEDLAKIRKEADNAKAQIRELLKNKPKYQEKIDPDVKELINKGLKR